MTELEKLAQLFEQFPGIGPRQAKRFVYFLLRADASYREQLTKNILSLSQGVTRCSLCGRYIPKQSSRCSICSDAGRDAHTLMIVAKDADVESFEHAGVFKGLYLVTGALIPLTEQQIPAKMRSSITERINTSQPTEIILALPVTTDGEHTREILTDTLKEMNQSWTITTLGRGLSTGSELEYADVETLENAFRSRRS